jgi:hypothetical protein
VPGDRGQDATRSPSTRAGAGGSARGSGPATATLDLGWEKFVRLATGRVGAADADVRVSGDRELAGRVLEHFAVTP